MDRGLILLTTKSQGSKKRKRLILWVFIRRSGKIQAIYYGMYVSINVMCVSTHYHIIELLNCNEKISPPITYSDLYIKI